MKLPTNVTRMCALRDMLYKELEKRAVSIQGYIFSNLDLDARKLLFLALKKYGFMSGDLFSGMQYDTTTIEHINLLRFVNIFWEEYTCEGNEYCGNIYIPVAVYDAGESAILSWFTEQVNQYTKDMINESDLNTEFLKTSV
jgi:hypothetical protein